MLFLHGVDALREVGVKGEELFAFLAESSDLRARADEDLLLRSSHSTSKVHSGYFWPGECFKNRLKARVTHLYFVE